MMNNITIIQQLFQTDHLQTPSFLFAYDGLGSCPVKLTPRPWLFSQWIERYPTLSAAALGPFYRSLYVHI